MTQPPSDPSFATAAGAEPETREAIFAAVYAELRRLAARELRRQGARLPMSPTTLLHEAYLDFHGRTGIVFRDRAAFLAYAARAMRGIIVDHVRERMTLKRGGGADITSLETEAAEACADHIDLASLSDALDELATEDAPLAELVDLKFFCGFTFREIAALRDVSERTVQRDWEKARLLLFRALRGEQTR